MGEYTEQHGLGALAERLGEYRKALKRNLISDELADHLIRDLHSSYIATLSPHLIIDPTIRLTNIENIAKA